MSNALSILNTNNLPAHLQGIATNLPSINLGGGVDTRNKITMKNGRFVLHIAGSQEKVLDVLKLPIIIVGAHDYVSRIFYKQKWQPGVKARPDCFSADGVTPAAGAPNKQATRCATCPQDAKGSGENGGRACGFFKRLVVLIAGKSTPFMLDVKSMSIFGTGNTQEGKYSLTEYSKLLAGKGINPSMVVTELTFDPNVSVPKIFFTPASFIDENMATQVASILADTDTIASYKSVEIDTLGDAPNTPPVNNDAPAPSNIRPTPAPAPAPALATQAAAQQAAAKPATTPAPTVRKFAVSPNDTVVEDLTPQPTAQTPAAAAVSADIDSLLDGIEF